MVDDLAKICSKAQSSSSSSTGIFCENNNNKYSPCGCNPCCPNPTINDHTYALLKRICRKIIKNYNRQQCREKYTVFDGGNSINLRIHRGSSFSGQDGTKHRDRMNAFGSRDNRGRSKGYNDNIAKSKNGSRALKSKGKRNLEDGEIGGKGSKGSRKPDSTDNGDSKDNKKQKNKAISGSDDKGFKQDEKAGAKNLSKGDKNQRSIEDDDEAGKKTSKNRLKGDKNQRSIEDDDEAGKKSSKNRLKGDKNQRSIEDDDEAGKKTSKNRLKGDKNQRSIEDDAEVGKKTAKSRIKGEKSRRSTEYDDDAGKKKSKNRLKGDKNRRSKDDDETGQKRSSRRKGKGKNSFVENGEKRLTKSKKSEFGASKKSKSDYRRGSSMGMSQSKTQKLQQYGSEKSRTTIGKPSRADEVRPCDVLRAQLEQRDFARSCGDPCQPCYPCRTCVPCQPSCGHNIYQKYVC